MLEILCSLIGQGFLYMLYIFAFIVEDAPLPFYTSLCYNIKYFFYCKELTIL